MGIDKSGLQLGHPWSVIRHKGPGDCQTGEWEAWKLDCSNRRVTFAFAERMNSRVLKPGDHG